MAALDGRSARRRRWPATLVAGLAVAIAATWVSLLPTLAAGRLRAKVVGHWALRSNAGQLPAQIVMAFDADGTFAFAGSADGAGEVALAGTWQVDADRALSLHITRVGLGDPATAGRRLSLGVVEAVDAHAMTLAANGKREVYERVP